MNIRTTFLTTLGVGAMLATAIATAHGHQKHGKHEAYVALGQSKISAIEAINAAERSSGAQAENLELDMHRGHAVFEIDLFDDKMEYEIHIDAQSGDIISRQSEYDDSLPRPTKISLAQAIEIAEAETGAKTVDADREGRSSGIIYEIKLLAEDGTRHYVDVHSEDGRIIDSGFRQARSDKHGEGRSNDNAPKS